MKKTANRWMGVAIAAALIAATATGCATDSELAEALTPDLWKYTDGDAGVNSILCFTGIKPGVSNYDAIPNDWKQ